MDCLVWEGLGNRFNALASSLVAANPGETVNLYWAVNKHCPLPFEEIFKPLDGVNVCNLSASQFAYSQSPNRICYYYACNPRNIRRRFGCRFGDCYALLLKHLKKVPPLNLENPIGIHYRDYMAESPPVDQFVEMALEWIGKRHHKQVFVASNSAEALRELEQLPNAISYPAKRQAKDFDRSEQGLIDWIGELQTFRKCRSGLLSSTYRSTVFDVFRGIKIQPHYMESEKNHRDISIERKINAAI